MRDNVPGEHPSTDGSTHHRPRQMMLLGAAALTLAAAMVGTFLLQSSPTRGSSPASAVTTTPTTPSQDEEYLRKVCGDDVNLSEGAHICMGRGRSLSPSEFAKMVEEVNNPHN